MLTRWTWQGGFTKLSALAFGTVVGCYVCAVIIIHGLTTFPRWVLAHMTSSMFFAFAVLASTTVLLSIIGMKVVRRVGMLVFVLIAWGTIVALFVIPFPASKDTIVRFMRLTA